MNGKHKLTSPNYPPESWLLLFLILHLNVLLADFFILFSYKKKAVLITYYLFFCKLGDSNHNVEEEEALGTKFCKKKFVTKLRPV